MKLLNLAEALQVAEFLDKPTLSDIDESFEMEEFSQQIIETLDDEELEKCLSLLFGAEVIIKKISLLDMAETLLRNGYFSLMESYFKLRGASNG